MLNWWSNLSISKKLYACVGIMAVLIAGELIILTTAMRTLSALRAFVEGEALWSKAQKNAAISFERYAYTKEEKEYEAFLDHLKIPNGDRKAREELLKKNPDLSIVREGFLEGKIDKDDIDSMIDLLRTFYWEKHISQALQAWTDADALLDTYVHTANSYHRSASSGSKNAKELYEILNKIKHLNEGLTELESKFSSVLGELSRWLEHLINSVLILVVITVETIGITLTLLTTRRLSRGLNQIQDLANRIGQGDFHASLPHQAQDEIGLLANSIGEMGTLLDKSYSHLEQRVFQRTQELEQLVIENQRLLKESQGAVNLRDEFLSVASHELKTPLTSLKMQLQMAKRTLEKQPEKDASVEKLLKSFAMSLRQVNLLSNLVDNLLDVSRLQSGKFFLSPEKTDLNAIIQDISKWFADGLKQASCDLSFELEADIFGYWDPYRIEQIFVNLISNIIKYAPGKPALITSKKIGDHAVITVQDWGSGIPEEKQDKIFERYERVDPSFHVAGLGLGLFIVKKMIEAHSGSIKFENIAPSGSKFTIRLPIQPDL